MTPKSKTKAPADLIADWWVFYFYWRDNWQKADKASMVTIVFWKA